MERAGNADQAIDLAERFAEFRKVVNEFKLRILKRLLTAQKPVLPPIQMYRPVSATIALPGQQ